MNTAMKMYVMNCWAWAAARSLGRLARDVIRERKAIFLSRHLAGHLVLSSTPSPSPLSPTPSSSSVTTPTSVARVSTPMPSSPPYPACPTSGIQIYLVWYVFFPGDWAPLSATAARKSKINGTTPNDLLDARVRHRAYIMP